VNDLAKQIIEIADSESEIVHLPMRAGEPPNSKICADTTALSNYFPLEFVDFAQGLRETVEYYAQLPASEVNKALHHFATETMRILGNPERLLDEQGIGYFSPSR